jgi:hypothetical protein
MPALLRPVSALLGAALLVPCASLAAELLQGSSSWMVGLIILYLFGIAVDLIAGAIRGKWPFWVLLALPW